MDNLGFYLQNRSLGHIPRRQEPQSPIYESEPEYQERSYLNSGSGALGLGAAGYGLYKYSKRRAARKAAGLKVMTPKSFGMGTLKHGGGLLGYSAAYYALDKGLEALGESEKERSRDTYFLDAAISAGLIGTGIYKKATTGSVKAVNPVRKYIAGIRTASKLAKYARTARKVGTISMGLGRLTPMIIGGTTGAATFNPLIGGLTWAAFTGLNYGLEKWAEGLEKVEKEATRARRPRRRLAIRLKGSVLR